MSVELDCCVLPLRNNLKLIQTTDFFYPLIDDPYTMGWITCCNVLSDLYAMGVVHCDNMLLLLGVAQELTSQERNVVIPLLMQGFRDCALEAGTYVRGGQTVLSPWLMMGGVATSVCVDSEYIMPNQALKGDKLVLTKPLGTQVAVNVHQWMLDNHPFWCQTLKNVTTSDEVKSLYQAATRSMAHLNKTAATLMHKYQAHGCTDVTGFGLMGHADNLAKFQATSNISFHIHTLPYLASSELYSKSLNDRFNIHKGLCPETSGGLLIILPRESAVAFCEELTRLENCPAWIIGDVVDAETKSAFLAPELNLLEVGHSQVGAPRWTAQN